MVVFGVGYFLQNKERLELSKENTADLTKLYRIAGASMEPNYKNGEMVKVDENIYQKSVPSHGDVIAFKFEYAKDVIVKRVAAVPGNQLLFKENEIFINNQKISTATKYNYAVWKLNSPMVIPENMYFVLSDNPAGWEDSRKWGFVPFKAIIGKVIKNN